MPPRPAFSSKSSESIDGDKIHEIRSACEKRDVDALRDLAASEGGLLEDKARREACMRRNTINCSIWVLILFI